MHGLPASVSELWVTETLFRGMHAQYERSECSNNAAGHQIR